MKMLILGSNLILMYLFVILFLIYLSIELRDKRKKEKIRKIDESLNKMARNILRMDNREFAMMMEKGRYQLSLDSYFEFVMNPVTKEMIIKHSAIPGINIANLKPIKNIIQLKAEQTNNNLSLEKVKKMWSQQQIDINQLTSKVDKNFLTDEERHKIFVTYPNDLKELREKYDALNQTTKKEMEIKIREMYEFLIKEIHYLEREAENRKKNDVEQKMAVIRSR